MQGCPRGKMAVRVWTIANHSRIQLRIDESFQNVATRRSARLVFGPIVNGRATAYDVLTKSRCNEVAVEVGSVNLTVT